MQIIVQEAGSYRLHAFSQGEEILLCDLCQNPNWTVQLEAEHLNTE